MRPFSRLMLCLATAVWLWLADALLFCFKAECGFGQALYSAVPSGRLLFRLILVVALLLLGVMGFIGHTVRRTELIRMNRAAGPALFGDEDSVHKSSRLLYHAMRLATLLKMPDKEREKLRILCYCYDIGMVAVPDEVLEKQSSLSPEEQRRRDSHTDLGAQIAAAIPQLRQAAPLIALHEEFYNGSGAHARYGRSIPLACRIFVVVLLYDYYTQPHAEGRVLDTQEALDEMNYYRGSMLDPDVLDAFIKLMSDDKLSRRVGESVYVP